MNYETLQTNIAAFLNREDLTDQIPMFIELAEARIRRDHLAGPPATGKGRGDGICRIYVPARDHVENNPSDC